MKGAASRHSQIALAATILVLAGAICLLGLRWYSSAHRPKSLMYFYNEKTALLFSASDQLLPPIDTDSGPDTGVKAYVFTCGDAKDTNGCFIAFLEKFTPEGKQAVRAQLDADHSPLAMGFALERHQAAILVRSPDQQVWHPKSSPEGIALMKAGRASGGCARPVLCLP